MRQCILHTPSVSLARHYSTHRKCRVIKNSGHALLDNLDQQPDGPCKDAKTWACRSKMNGASEVKPSRMEGSRVGISRHPLLRGNEPIVLMNKIDRHSRATVREKLSNAPLLPGKLAYGALLDLG